MHKKNHLYYYFENDVRKHDSIAQLYKYEKENHRLEVRNSTVKTVVFQKRYINKI